MNARKYPARPQSWPKHSKLKGLKDGDWVKVEEMGIYPWQGELRFGKFGPFVLELGEKRHFVHDEMKITKYD